MPLRGTEQGNAPVMSRITGPLGVGQPCPGRRAHATTLLGTQYLRGVTSGEWRGDVSPVRSPREPGEEAVGGWATAESSATGCGADHDRMTSVPVEARW